MRDGTVFELPRPAVDEPARPQAHLVPPDATQWTEALRRAEHDIYHLPEYVCLDARVAGGTATAFWYREESHVFLLPLILRDIPGSGLSDAASPYGYPAPISDADVSDVGFWERACKSMVDTLGGQGIVTAFVRLHPLLAFPQDVFDCVGLVMRHGETLSADLSLSVEEMWRQTRRDHRNHVNRGRRAGVEVVIDDWSRLDEWIQVYYDNMRRLGAAEYYFFPVEHMVALHEAVGDRLHLAVALADNEVIGGTTFFEYRGVCQGYIMSARRDPTRHPDKVLYDEVRRWAKDRGNTVFHFGGGVGGRNDSLFSYKAGFSNQRHPFHTWRVVTDAVAYRSLPGGGQRPDRADLSGHFPPYRRGT
jgi:hypothetical protein